jgi:uncharacterized protein DUF5666
MRTLLLGLAFVGTLAAQPDVPTERCLPGTLLSIQPDSITLKFNERITTFRLAPDAEIWRRGTDVASLKQLVVGDDVYLKCSQSGEEVVASVVAAVEAGGQVDMEPHHLKEIAVCMGHLVAITKDTLSMKNDAGVCVVHIPPGIEIWRGEIYHDTSALKLGDEVGARATIGYPDRELTAESVEANVAKAEGKIVSVASDRIVVKDRGRVTVLFDSRTALDLDQGELKKGAYVLAIGLDLGHNSFRATSIAVEK